MIINKFILHIFHCLVQSTWKPCACVSLRFFRRSRFTDENFLDFDLVARNRRRWNTTVSPTMNRNRLRLISSPPLPPFFPRLGIIFIKKNSRANLLPQKKKIYHVEKRKKERKKRSYQPFLGLLCNYVLGRDSIENTFLEPLSPPVLEIIPRKQYHFSMYRFLRYWKETPMFAIVSLNLDDFQVERKSGLTKFWRR